MHAALDVLFEDEALLVLRKPSGVSVHRGLDAERDTIVERLRAAGAGASPVHRLDRGTSGVLVCAKHASIAATLGRAFADGGVEKTYVALVRGEAPEAALVDHPVRAGESGVARELVDARTTCERVATVHVEASMLRERRYSLVRAQPHTGRFHQVRRHLKHLGHPVIGDANYGRSEHNRFCAATFGLRRLALHAASLTLVHPTTGGMTVLVAPLPTDLVAPLTDMGFAPRTLGEICSPASVGEVR